MKKNIVKTSAIILKHLFDKLYIKLCVMPSQRNGCIVSKIYFLNLLEFFYQG